MLRTALAALSVSGVTLIRSPFVVRAKESKEPKTTIISEPASRITSDFESCLLAEESDQNNPWIAEPLTDEKTRKEKSKEMRTRMELMILKIQQDFVNALQREEDPRYRFRVDRWTRTEGGGGVTCVLQDGHVFEKAGVNVSVVHGHIPPAAVKQGRNCIHFEHANEPVNLELFMNTRGKDLPEGKEMPFFACGVSSVVHPRNPNVPTMHFNYRYFEIEEESGRFRWWFGGGCDLTPYYLDEADVKMFHGVLKAACDKHHKSYYHKFKEWCDKYFRISHRGITRGIGGIFFDDLDKPNQDKCFQFVSDLGKTTIPCYLPIVRKQKDAPYGYEERQWQLIRRGHYTEFNLVYDRGTKFGLYTPGARYESILMSLPLTAKWEYMHTIKAGSREEKLTEVLKNPREWV